MPYQFDDVTGEIINEEQQKKKQGAPPAVPSPGAEPSDAPHKVAHADKSPGKR